MVLHLYLPDTGFDLSRIFNLVGPQTEHIPVRSTSLISDTLCFIFIYWTGDSNNVATTGTGTIKKIPDQFIVLKGCHYAKNL